MSIDISEGINEGNVEIKIITTNTVISTLLTDERFNGKVIQPQTNGSKYIAEHGLAMIINVKEDDHTTSILLDTGGPRNSVIPNAESMSIDFSTIDKFVLSHGHVDHYGGVMEVFPRLKKGCELIISPNAYEDNVILIPKKRGDYYTPEELNENYRTLRKENAFIYEVKLPTFKKALVDKYVQENDLKLIETTEPYNLAEGVITSGEIELFDEEEVSKGFYLMKGRNNFIKNTFRDETSIYFNVKNKGLVVITGCGHTGIINTIKHAQKITGIDEVYAVIGGFHKEWEKDQDIQNVVNMIKDLNPEITCGMHCTGYQFNNMMAGHPSHVYGIVGTEFHL